MKKYAKIIDEKTKQVQVNSDWYKQYRFIVMAMYLTRRTSPTHIVNLNSAFYPTEYISFAMSDASPTSIQYQYIDLTYGEKATFVVNRKSYGFDMQLYLYFSSWIGYNLLGVIIGAK